jgi:hypothetical protein
LVLVVGLLRGGCCAVRQRAGHGRCERGGAAEARASLLLKVGAKGLQQWGAAAFERHLRCCFDP